MTLLPLAGKGNYRPAHIINQHPAAFPTILRVSSCEKKICPLCPLSSTKMEYLVLYEGQESGFASRSKEQEGFFFYRLLV